MQPNLDRLATRTDLEERCRDALLLWLRWNDGYERVTQAMFDASGNQGRVEELMDQLEELRRRAVEASRELLDVPEPG